MRAVLEQYTVRGSMGHLLDASEDGLELSDFTVFEIEELMALGDRFALARALVPVPPHRTLARTASPPRSCSTKRG